MANTKRETMREIACGQRIRMQSGPALRTGKSSRRGVMTEVEPPAPEVIEIPAEIATEIPPLEDEDDPIVAAIAEGEAEVVIDGEEIGEETQGPEIPVQESNPAEGTLEWNPVTGGVDCEPRIVVYDPGDGIPRAIPDPLGVL